MSHTHVPLNIKQSHLVMLLLLASFLLTGTLVLESMYTEKTPPQVLGVESK